MNPMASTIAKDRAALARSLAALTVEVQSERGGGSGVLWAEQGLVITCSHVLGGSEALVDLPAGRQARGTVVARDDRADLALLRVGHVEGPPLTFRHGPLRAGELLFAMGNPFGERGVLTSGVVLAQPGDGFLHADLRVAPGNSGGPLIDARGRLVGVVSMYRGGAAAAVPVHRIDALVEERRRESAA